MNPIHRMFRLLHRKIPSGCLVGRDDEAEDLLSQEIQTCLEKGDLVVLYKLISYLLWQIESVRILQNKILAEYLQLFLRSMTMANRTLESHLLLSPVWSWIDRWKNNREFSTDDEEGLMELIEAQSDAWIEHAPLDRLFEPLKEIDAPPALFLKAVRRRTPDDFPEFLLKKEKELTDSEIRTALRFFKAGSSPTASKVVMLQSALNLSANDSSKRIQRILHEVEEEFKGN